MRVLWLPLIGISQIESDSDYLIYKDLIGLASKKGWYNYFVLPDKYKGKITVGLERCKEIYLPMRNDFFDESMSCPNGLSDLFARRIGEYQIDVIITTRTGGAQIIQEVMSDYRKRYNVPVIIIEAMVRGWKVPSPADALMRAMSYCTSWTWLLSEEEKMRALDIIREYCSYSMMNKFLEKCLVEGTGVRTEYIDKIINGVEKEKKFTLFFGGRFSMEKDPEAMNKFMFNMYAFGRDINIFVTTQTVGGNILRKYVKDNCYHVFKKGCSREDFLKTCASSHVFVCTSLDESWPSGFWEQLYILQIGIFPDRKWVRANLPKKYPYVYKNQIEAQAMLRQIYSNYEESLKKVSWIRQWIRDNVNWKAQSNKVLEWIEKDVEKPCYKVCPAIRELLYGCAKELGGVFKWHDFLNLVKVRADNFDPIKEAKYKFPNRYQLYREMLKKYEDNCEEEYPLFIERRK